MPRLSAIAWVGLAACAAMLIGAFGPWAKVVGLVNLSISGTDGENDGWLVVGAALVGFGSLALYARGTVVGFGSPPRFVRGKLLGAVGALLAGAAGAAVTIYDRGNISDVADENSSDLASFEIGWGLNLAMGASLALALTGLIALLGANRTKAADTKPADAASAADATTAPSVTTASATAPRQPESSPTSTEPTAAPIPNRSTADELEKLADLHDRGVLTQDELQKAKARLLDDGTQHSRSG